MDSTVRDIDAALRLRRGGSLELKDPMWLLRLARMKEGLLISDCPQSIAFGDIVIEDECLRRLMVDIKTEGVYQRGMWTVPKDDNPWLVYQ